MEYSNLTNDEIEEIQQVEEKLNEDRVEPVIILAVDDKQDIYLSIIVKGG